MKSDCLYLSRPVLLWVAQGQAHPGPGVLRRRRPYRTEIMCSAAARNDLDDLEILVSHWLCVCVSVCLSVGECMWVCVHVCVGVYGACESGCVDLPRSQWVVCVGVRVDVPCTPRTRTCARPHRRPRGARKMFSLCSVRNRRHRRFQFIEQSVRSQTSVLD